jgi:ribokinase
LWHIDDDVAVTPATVRDAGPAIERADAVLLTFEMPPDSISETIRTASDLGKRVVVQPAPVLYDRAAAHTLPWDRVDVLVPNEDEARALLTGPDVELPAAHLAAALDDRLHVPTIVVTVGESGCIVHTDGRSRQHLPPDVVAVDTTGASDAFIATFAAHLIAGATANDAADAAQSAAVRAIQQPGGYESMPSY